MKRPRVVAVREVIVQKLEQGVPGQLGKLTRRMAEAGVNIEVLYSDHANQLVLVVNDPAGPQPGPRRFAAADHHAAANALLDWLEAQPSFASVSAVGHRVVHGMQHAQPERVTPKLLAELRRITPYDPEHLEKRASEYSHARFGERLHAAVASVMTGSNVRPR